MRLLFLNCILIFFVYELCLGQSKQGKYVLFEQISENEYVEILPLEGIRVYNDTVEIIKRDTIYINATTIQELSKNSGLSYVDFMKVLLKFLEENKKNGFIDDSINSLTKELMDDIYDKIYDNQYIVNTYFIDPNTNRIEGVSGHILDISNIPDSKELEFLFIQKGSSSTNNFFNTTNEQARVLTTMLEDITSNNAIKGKQIALNFDFQDYDFSEKRKLYQFAKSVSLVMDSIKVKEIREAKLYFTFSKKSVDNFEDDIIGLYEMLDGIYVVNPDTHERYSISKYKLSTLTNIRNQFLFARFDINKFPVLEENKINYKTIELLMNSDYPEEWEEYFFAIIILLIIMIIGAFCFFKIPRFFNYCNSNYLYVLSGCIIMLAEIIILFIYMIEEMGSKTKIITLKDIVLFQFVLLLVVPILIKTIQKKEIP